MTIYKKITDIIGKTPLLELSNIEKEQNSGGISFVVSFDCFLINIKSNYTILIVNKTDETIFSDLADDDLWRGYCCGTKIL